MEIIKSRQQMILIAREAHRAKRTIGFVPTMGALHEGHLSLVRTARAKCDVVVVSIFVNPTQFDRPKDLDSYPRDLKRDATLLAVEKVDYIFAPPLEEIYPREFSTYVTVEALTNKLEGAARPGHFRGVTTVVNKLFNVVQPNFAFFGRKDAQQVILIKRMVRDLGVDVEIVVGPVVREEDGLALSSRNLQHVTCVAPGGINVYNLLTHERVALTRDAAALIEKQLGGNAEAAAAQTDAAPQAQADESSTELSAGEAVQAPVETVPPVEVEEAAPEAQEE